jgi:hypothetical protein
MPTNFPKGDDGKRMSPIAALLDAPTFAADRAEFARLLGSDEAAKAFLNDPDQVTKALRDYVWSVGITGGTAPAGSTEPGPAARPTEPSKAAVRTSRSFGGRTASAPGR